MAKTSVETLILRHPMTRQGEENANDYAEMWIHQGYMLHRELPEGFQVQVKTRSGEERTITVGGSVQAFEFRKTLDYNRAERRAAKQSGQDLRVNSFKGILPDGYQPIMPDDPRLQVPPPPAG